MQSTIIVLIKTVTSVEEKTVNVLIFKNESLPMFPVMIVVRENCFTTNKKKVCRLFKKCPECCKVYKYSKKKKRVRRIPLSQLPKQSFTKPSVLHSTP